MSIDLLEQTLINFVERAATLTDIKWNFPPIAHSPYDLLLRVNEGALGTRKHYIGQQIN